jgi:hypothetical protein
MDNAEEFPGQRSSLRRVRPTYRRPGTRAGAGRIRYAHGGPPSRVQPFCAVPQGPGGYHRGDGGAEGVWDGGDVGGVWDGGDAGTWGGLTGPPAAGSHSDLWVLVCGGIAAVAAFAAAFVASGGLATHPASPGATMPAVVSQACPSPAAGPTP